MTLGNTKTPLAPKSEIVNWPEWFHDFMFEVNRLRAKADENNRRRRQKRAGLLVINGATK